MDARQFMALSLSTCSHMEGLEKSNLPRASKVATFVKTVSETYWMLKKNKNPLSHFVQVRVKSGVSPQDYYDSTESKQ